MLGIPNLQKEIHRLKTAQAHCSLQRLFFGWLFIFYTVLGCDMYNILPPSDWLEKTDFFVNSGTFTQPVHPSNRYNPLSKTKAPLLCWDKFNFLCNTEDQSLPTDFPELNDHTALAHLFRAFLSCRGLIICHNQLHLGSLPTLSACGPC